MNNKNVVLACIDGSSVREPVCDYASWISKKVEAPLTLLHTIEHAHTPPVSDYSGAIGLGTREELLEELTEVEQSRSRLLIEKGQDMLRVAQERVVASGVEAPQLCQRHGTLSESLIDLEETTRVLVLGIRGEHHENESGISTQLESIIRSLHRPILVVNKEYTEPKKIMLAYDGSDSCKKALDMVASSILFKGIPCHLVHVGDQGESLLNEAAKVLRGADVEVTTIALSGKIDEALTAYQAEQDIDLMLMGAFSHSRFRGLLLGSFTEKMLKNTNKPLLLLR
ncbi:MAG: universal stress protein [Agarilytica sp.]